MITRQVLSFFFFLVLVILACWYVDSLAHDELRWTARLLVSTAGIGAVVMLVVAVVAGSLILHEHLRTARARRRLIEREAAVMVVTAGPQEQVHIRETDRRAVWRPAHLDARIYANGQQTGPTPAEIAAWAAFNRPRVIEAQQLGALPAGEPANHAAVDLLQVLNTAQCALIVGQRDSGKTTLLQHTISRRLEHSHVLVLDPHNHPARWPAGCKVVGTQRDFQAIGEALKALEALMNKRYREIGKGLVKEGDHERVTVVIDEWRAIVLNLGKEAGDIIKTLLAESRKTNIDIFVGTHSERVKALGIEGEGDLKEGFVLVRLTVNKVTKERRATVDFGEGEIPAILPGPYYGGGRPLLDNPAEFTSPSSTRCWVDVEEEPEPSPQEAEILYLSEQGRSFREISQAIWGEGKYGQFYNDKIAEVLEKYGEK